MQIETDALYKTQIWELVRAPRGVNIFRSRWIYKIKRHADGTVEWFKASLVAKHYTQECGLITTRRFAELSKQHLSVRFSLLMFQMVGKLSNSR